MNNMVSPVRCPAQHLHYASTMSYPPSLSIFRPRVSPSDKIKAINLRYTP